MNSMNSHKILVIGPSWVGDMIMAQSLFKVLFQQHENAEITVIAPPFTQPLLARMPEVNESLTLDLAHGELNLKKRWRLGKELVSRSFDHAYVLPNSFKSALIPFHAGITQRTGWSGELRWPLLTDTRQLDKCKYPLMVQRFVALAYPPDAAPPIDCPKPRLTVESLRQTETLRAFGLQNRSRVIGICPGAEFGPAKQWPAEHYAELVNDLLDKGREVWFFGSPKDALMVESILADVEPSLLARCRNLAGRTSLGQAIDLLAATEAVVSNDSGLMHIAAALKKPVIVIYGSTTPDFTPPLADRVKLLSTEVECRPCFERTCPFGHLRCLKELRPELAIDAAAELLEAANVSTEATETRLRML